MKKVLLLLLICFLVFGIMLNFPLISAKKGDNPGKGQGNQGNSAAQSSGGDTNADSDDIITSMTVEDDDSADEDEEDDNEGRARGKRHIKIRGTEAETELELEGEIEGNETEFNVILSNRNKSKVKVMPNQVPEIVRARIKNMGDNYSIELKEKVHKNIPRVVYNVQTNQNGRFLGVFKLAMRAEVEIDPETGDIISLSRPWWAFLVSVPEEPEEPEEPDNETNQTENNPPVIISNPVTIADENASYIYQVIATDADNDTLTYSLIQTPVWLSINSSTGLITGTTPLITNNTNYTINLNVSDEIDFDTQTYNLTVNNIA